MSNIHLTEDQRKKLKSSLDEVVNSWTRMDAEREYVNETLKELKENYNIDKKLLREVAKVMYNTNYDSVTEKYQSIEELYIKLTNFTGDYDVENE